MKFHELKKFTDRFLIDEVCHMCGSNLLYTDDAQYNEICYYCPEDFNWADRHHGGHKMSHFTSVIRYIRDGSQDDYLSHINYRLIDNDNRSIWICNDYKTNTCEVLQMKISSMNMLSIPEFEYETLFCFSGVCPSVPNILQSALDSYLLT